MQTRNPRPSTVVRAERLDVIRICEVIAGDIRLLKAQKDVQHSFVPPEKIRQLHVAAVKRFCDAQQRLRLLNAELKAANIEEQELGRIEAQRARAARRNN
jgi:hypothetical protein